jgi:anti-anti-sigma factor
MNALSITQLGGDTISVSGEVDAASAPQLTAAATALGSKVRIECSKCTFIDSAGVSALLAISERAKLAGGQVTLIDPSRAVNRLLELCGLTDNEAFEITGTGGPDQGT